jgi:hypothetical protein
MPHEEWLENKYAICDDLASEKENINIYYFIVNNSIGFNASAEKTEQLLDQLRN